MTEITHNGWRLVTEEERDGDGFICYEHFAERGDVLVHLLGSGFRGNFWPTAERFAWLVDHGFPPAPRDGNWFNDELDELIEKGKYDGADGNEPSAEASVVEGEVGVNEVLRDLPERDTQT